MAWHVVVEGFSVGDVVLDVWGLFVCLCECAMCGCCWKRLDAGGLSLLEELRDGLLEFDRCLCELTLEVGPFVL